MAQVVKFRVGSRFIRNLTTELATVVYRVLQQAQAKRTVHCDWIIDTTNETARYRYRVA